MPSNLKGTLFRNLASTVYLEYADRPRHSTGMPGQEQIVKSNAPFALELPYSQQNLTNATPEINIDGAIVRNQ
jgi:hypothetical protein